MAAAVTARIAEPSHQPHADDVGHHVAFNIGTLVHVESRTWPGINKPGGVGRVVSFDVPNCCVDVKYVLGGEEKGIDLEFVKLHKFDGDDDDNGGSGRARRRNRVKDDSNTSLVNTNTTIVKVVKKETTTKKALKDASNRANKVTSKVTTAAGSTGSKRKGQHEAKVEKKGSKKAKEAVQTPIVADIADAKQNVKSDKKTKKNKCAVPVASLKKNPSGEPTQENAQIKASKHTEQLSSSPPQRWAISPALVLQNVYKGMKQRGANFVQEIVGMKNSAPSSPESHSSLEIQIKEG